MEVTGGLIRTYKYQWYLINYVCKTGKQVANDPDIGLDLVETGVDGDKVSLNKLRSDEAAEVLGVRITPNGNKQE